MTVVTSNYCIYTKLDPWVNVVAFLLADIFMHWISAKNPTQESRFLLNHPNFSLTPKISFKFRTLNQ